MSLFEKKRVEAQRSGSTLRLGGEKEEKERREVLTHIHTAPVHRRVPSNGSGSGRTNPGNGEAKNKGVSDEGGYFEALIQGHREAGAGRGRGLT